MSLGSSYLEVSVEEIPLHDMSSSCQKEVDEMEVDPSLLLTDEFGLTTKGVSNICLVRGSKGHLLRYCVFATDSNCHTYPDQLLLEISA
eukprot:3075586-Pyramimonas_sp.AAC.1